MAKREKIALVAVSHLWQVVHMNKSFIMLGLSILLVGKALAAPANSSPGVRNKGGDSSSGVSLPGARPVPSAAGGSNNTAPPSGSKGRSLPVGAVASTGKAIPVGDAGRAEASQQEAFFTAIERSCRLLAGPYTFAHDVACQQGLDSFQRWLLTEKCELRPRYIFLASVLVLQCKRRNLGSEQDEWYPRWKQAELVLRKPRVSRDTEEQRREAVRQACVFRKFEEGELQFEAKDSLPACASAVEKALADNVPPFSVCREDISYDVKDGFSLVCKTAPKKEAPRFDWWKETDSGPEKPSSAEWALWKACDLHLSKQAEKRGFVGLLANPKPACVEHMAHWSRGKYTQDFGWLRSHACNVWSRDTDTSDGTEPLRWDADTYQTIILCQKDPSSGFSKE